VGVAGDGWAQASEEADRAPAAAPSRPRQWRGPRRQGSVNKRGRTRVRGDRMGGANPVPFALPVCHHWGVAEMSDLVFIAVTIAVFAVLALVAKGVGRL
jgi:hypothetical protein